MPALGNAQQVLMEEIMEEEEKEEANRDPIQMETLDLGRLDTGPINDGVPSSSSSSSSSGTHLDTDEAAIAEAQDGPSVFTKDFDLLQRKLHSAADAAREEESFQSFY